MTIFNEALEPPRHTYLGASEIAAALGLSTYKTAHEVWAEKTGRRTREGDSGDTLRGRFLEPIVRDHCLPADPRVEGVVQPRGFHQHPQHPWTGAHDDGGLAGLGFPVLGTLEIKNPNGHTFRIIREQGLPNENVIQITLTMGLVNEPWGGFAVHCADSWETLIFPVEFDAELFGYLQRQGRVFMEQFVAKDRPPPLLVEETVPEIPKIRGEAVYREDDEWKEIQSDWEVLRQTKAELEKLWEGDEENPGMKKRILELMGNEKIVIGGGYKTVRIQQPGKLYFSKEALESVGPYDPRKVEGILIEDADMDPGNLAELMERLRLEARLTATDPRLYKQSAPFEYPQAYALKEG